MSRRRPRAWRQRLGPRGGRRVRRRRPAAAARPGAARRDPAAPADGVPDPQAALRPLHPGDGPRRLRHQHRGLRLSRPLHHRELRPRAHHLLRLCRRLDSAHPGRPIHPHRSDFAAACWATSAARAAASWRCAATPASRAPPTSRRCSICFPATCRCRRRARTTPSPTTSRRSGRRSRKASGPTPTPTWSACSRRGGVTPPGRTTTGPTTTCRGCPARTAPTRP